MNEKQEKEFRELWMATNFKAVDSGWREYCNFISQIQQILSSDSVKECGCRRCGLIKYSRMYVCDICGNKRCPHATDHTLACTNSNEVGQKGSDYEFPDVQSKSDSALVENGVKEFSDALKGMIEDDKEKMLRTYGNNHMISKVYMRCTMFINELLQFQEGVKK